MAGVWHLARLVVYPSACLTTYRWWWSHTNKLAASEDPYSLHHNSTHPKCRSMNFNCPSLSRNKYCELSSDKLWLIFQCWISSFKTIICFCVIKMRYFTFLHLRLCWFSSFFLLIMIFVQEVAHGLLRSLVPLGSSMVCGGNEGLASLTHLLTIMSSLASAGSGTGHVTLFRAATLWVTQWWVLDLYTYFFFWHSGILWVKLWDSFGCLFVSQCHCLIIIAFSSSIIHCATRVFICPVVFSRAYLSRVLQ